jgi:hypothetical protein
MPLTSGTASEGSHVYRTVDSPYLSGDLRADACIEVLTDAYEVSQRPPDQDKPFPVLAAALAAVKDGL